MMRLAADITKNLQDYYNSSGNISYQGLVHKEKKQADLGGKFFIDSSAEGCSKLRLPFAGKCIVTKTHVHVPSATFMECGTVTLKGVQHSIVVYPYPNMSTIPAWSAKRVAGDDADAHGKPATMRVGHCCV